MSLFYRGKQEAVNAKEICILTYDTVNALELLIGLLLRNQVPLARDAGIAIEHVDGKAVFRVTRIQQRNRFDPGRAKTEFEQQGPQTLRQIGIGHTQVPGVEDAPRQRLIVTVEDGARPVGFEHGDAPTGLEHAVKLVQRPTQVIDVEQRLGTAQCVETRVFERQFLGATLLQMHLFETLAAGGGMFQHVFAVIKPLGTTLGTYGQRLELEQQSCAAAGIQNAFTTAQRQPVEGAQALVDDFGRLITAVDQRGGFLVVFFQRAGIRIRSSD